MSTITFVGTGTTVSAVNASVTPAFHANTAVGDLVLLHASIRNSGTGTVDLPTGWTSLVNFGNERIMGRFYQSGDVAPTVTFTGGVANADTICQPSSWRGVSRETLNGVVASATQLNGAAQDILYPALAVAKDRHLIILAAWKQDDVNTVTIPAGFSSIATVTAVVAGDDAGQTWRYQVQTTAANISGGTLTIGGGAAAISRAILFSLKPAPSIAATAQDTYPTRVLVSVTDLTIGDDVAVYRVVSGERTAVRAGSSDAVTDPSFLVVDAELPFGVPVSYLAVVEGVEITTAAVTYTLAGGKVAVTDAITGLAAEVVILAAPERAYDPRSTTFRVGGRNLAVIGATAGFTGSIELYVETTSSRENLLELLAGATEGVVQIRQPGAYDGVDCHVAVLGVTERRWSQDGTDQRRVVALEVLEVEPWADTLAAATYTYADLEALYTGLTYANLAAGYATYLALAQAELT
jgi:hypothetical protein